MSLLQISEPGSAPKAPCKKRVVGIDLGTTHSLVATVTDGTPIVLGDEPLVPSVVRYCEGCVEVGQCAKDSAEIDPTNTIVSVKRFVGRSKKEIVGCEVPYELGDSSDRYITFLTRRGEKNPVEVSAEILKNLKERAEEAMGGEVEAAVITVPAYFDDAQRQATKDAGKLAGLEVMRLLAEPTAAALAYGLDSNAQGTFAVYDLGGGTFDISILQLTEGVFKVISTGGDTSLGGDDIDRAIASYLLAETGYVWESLSTTEVRTIVTVGRRAKEALSETEEPQIPFSIDGKSFSKALTRTSLASLAKPWLDRTGKACRRALKDAELTKADLDGVLLVGGSTRSPVVHQYVESWFGQKPLGNIDPDQVVALGAAIQAEQLAAGTQEVLLLDVIPLSLGVETMGGVVEKLIWRNSTIPAGAKQEFTTYADNQTGFNIHVVQGERETVEGCRSLAKFQLKGIPPMVAGMARVEIMYQVDADGLLQVSAKEMTTGLENTIEVKPSYGLTDDEVERMLVESYEHAETDLMERNLRTERTEAERILQATVIAMEDDAGLLDSETKAATEKAIGHLRQVMEGDDYLAIRKGVEALDHASKPFAQKRMNRAVQAAFKGKSIQDIEGAETNA